MSKPAAATISNGCFDESILSDVLDWVRGELVAALAAGMHAKVIINAADIRDISFVIEKHGRTHRPKAHNRV